MSVTVYGLFFFGVAAGELQGLQACMVGPSVQVGRRCGASISAWEGHREIQQILEKPKKVCRSHVPPFPGLKLAVSYGVPRPAQARVAPAQGENGASPLRKIRERQKMGLRGSDQNG